MKQAPHTNYAHLKAHLQAWPHRQEALETASQAAFVGVMEDQLLPELQKLAAVLQDAGMDCTVFRDEVQNTGVWLRIEDLQTTIGLSPSDGDRYLRAVVLRDTRPNGQLEWCIPYARIQQGLLERELQAAVVRLLTPLGTGSAGTHRGPTP